MQATTQQVVFLAPDIPDFARILTPQAISFAADLQRKFGRRRKELLQRRTERQEQLNAGAWPDFLTETADIRSSNWTVEPLPADLLDRRVEITGPTDRKMVINALNSGARVFMADFEDSTAPTWENIIGGQMNLRDAIRRTITFEDIASGKQYKLNSKPAVLFARVRGWHMEERHLLVDGEVMSASLFDFALYAFHNATELLARGSGPYFYLPKMEGHLEARLWNEIFNEAEEHLQLPAHSIKATVLIETILAAFEMDEILYELRTHSAGLNCGRWDYIFSYIKKFAAKPGLLLPDRAQITMTTHFMRSYSKLCIKTCHRRHVSAMGGMSALIPIKNDPAANAKAMAGVRADKEREARDGHDGTWVAHPGLVPVAMEVFDSLMPEPNQISKQLPDFHVTAEDLLRAPDGTITAAGLRQNVAVGLRYLEAWRRGIGCVPLFNLMEDAATAEISRAQLWQWVHHGAMLEDGSSVSVELFNAVLDAERDHLLWAAGRDRETSVRHATKLMRELICSDKFTEFLTQPAYNDLIAGERGAVGT